MATQINVQIPPTYLPPTEESPITREIRFTPQWVEWYLGVQRVINQIPNIYLQGNLYRPVYVTDPPYNAVGDGVTDDTAAIQAAITASSDLVVPEGTYMVSALTIDHDITITGSGTIKQIAGTAADMITVTGTGTSTKLTMRGVTLDGNEANQAAETDWATVKITALGTDSDPSVFEFDGVTFLNGVWADLTLKNDATRTTVDKLIVRGCKFLGGREGTTQADDTRYLDIRSPVDYVVSGCVLDLMRTPAEFGRAGILAYDGHSTLFESARGVISGNHLVNVGRSETNSILGAIDLYSRGRATSVTGNTLINPIGRGIQCKSDAAAVAIVGNVVDGLSGVAMNAQITCNASTNTSTGGSVVISANTCIDSGKDAISVTQSNSNDTDYATGVLVTGNTISGATRRAIGIVDASDASIVGNVIENGETGIYVQDAVGMIQISINEIRGCSGVGVQVPNSNTLASFTISGNHIQDTGGRGIYVSSGVRGKIAGNTILDTGAAAIEVTGTTGRWSVVENSANVDPAFTNGGTNTALYIGRNDFESGLTTTARTVTIASGAITATMDYHWVDTEGAAATDDLTTINGGYDGQILTLRARDTNRTVVVKDTTQLRLAGDMTLDNVQDTITLRWITSEGVWLEIGRANSGT